jgi:cytochrome b involved in lipid metabolism
MGQEASAAAEPARQLQEFTRAQVESEASETRVLVIIEDGVYDLTSFAREHPGGEEIVLSFAGRDASSAFESVGHSTRAHVLKEKYKVGVLVRAVSQAD